jgi:hypothetical protein
MEGGAPPPWSISLGFRRRACKCQDCIGSRHAAVLRRGSFQLNVACHTNLACIRMVVRIMLMVPIYAISSLISLFSLEAAFVIDAIRDIYEVRRASSKLPYSVTMASTGVRNLLLFSTTSRISWWGAFAPHSSAWPPTQSYPLSHECLPTRARRQRPLHIFIPQTRNSPYVRYLHTALTF